MTAKESQRRNFFEFSKKKFCVGRTVTYVRDSRRMSVCLSVNKQSVPAVTVKFTVSSYDLSKEPELKLMTA